MSNARPFNEMTEEQIQSIMETLSEGRTEDSNLMKKIIDEGTEGELLPRYVGIPENTEDNPYPYNAIKKEVITNDKYIEIDPKTGRETEVAFESNAASLTEEIFNESTANIKDRTDTLKSFGLSNEDSVEVFSIITRFKNGEKFNVYHELPESIQVLVRQLNGPNMSTINSTAKDVLNHFIREMAMDNEFIDLQQSISKELGLLNISEMYTDELKTKMEVDLIKVADKFDEQGHHDKAESLRNVSAAFTDSYTFTTITKQLNENELIRRKIKKDLSRYKKFTNDFNYKYEKSKFKINNIRLIDSVLPDIMRKDSVTTDDIKKFIIVICKAMQPLSSEDPIHHVLMYYTIQNILLLKYVDLDNSSFGKEIYNNLLRTINLMKEIERNECISSSK